MLSVPQEQVIIQDNSTEGQVQFYQDKVSLIDTEEYSRFIYSAETMFRHSRFYKAYKAAIMNRGLFFDQQMRGITSEMADIEMHHHLPTLKDAAIIITEYYLNTTNLVNSYMIARELEELHRNNMMGVIMLSKTIHQSFHNDPNGFISITQLYGNPFAFLQKYAKYFPLDIAMKWLLQFKLEDQFGNRSVWYNIPIAREVLLNWSKQI